MDPTGELRAAERRSIGSRAGANEPHEPVAYPVTGYPPPSNMNNNSTWRYLFLGTTAPHPPRMTSRLLASNETAGWRPDNAAVTLTGPACVSIDTCPSSAS